MKKIDTNALTFTLVFGAVTAMTVYSAGVILSTPGVPVILAPLMLVLATLTGYVTWKQYKEISQ